MAQTITNSPTMQETWFPSLAREDPLEKGMATHSGVLVGERSKDISWTEEPSGL